MRRPRTVRIITALSLVLPLLTTVNVPLSAQQSATPPTGEEPARLPDTVPTASEGTSPPPILTNTDILDLHTAGIRKDVILALIRATPSKFDTSPAALLELKNANVSDEIILAIVKAASVLAPVSEPTAQQASSTSVPTGVPQIEAAPPTLAIPDGTPVEIELVENVSSEAVQEGSLIDFTVIQDVRIDGVTVIARGAPARGRVQEVKKARRWGRAGKLVWAIQDVHAVDGQRIPLRLTKELEGGGSSGKVAAAVVVTAILFFPAAPLWGLKKGKPAIIPAGTRVSAFAHGDSAIEISPREREKETSSSER